MQRSPGKRTLTERLVQRRPAAAPEGTGDAETRSIAAEGVAGPGAAMPHGAAIAESFGKYGALVGGIDAHVGGAAADAAGAIGAQAYTAGSSVAFASAPDLGLAAHEAAHVVQQTRGVHLKGGVGEAGDVYEQHADAVAEQVVRGGSAEALLDDLAGPAAGGAAVQRKEGAPGGGEGAQQHDDAVFGGTRHTVATPKTWLVSNPSTYQSSLVCKLDKGENVQLLDTGSGEKFNQVTDAKYKWWKVKVTAGAHANTEGWVMAGLLKSRIETTTTGTTEHTGKVGQGEVTVTTGDTVEYDGAAVGDNMFSIGYQGVDADKMRWLQFIWREVIGVDDKGASKPVTGSITTTGGTYDLTEGGTKDAFGAPKKNNYNTDSGDATDPFYEGAGASTRTKDSSTMHDQPYGANDKAKEAFDAGAKSAIARAHFSTFLVKDEKTVQYQTYVDIQWDYAKKEDTDAPPKGKHTVSNSGAANSLPPTIAERLHEQFPATKDLK